MITEKITYDCGGITLQGYLAAPNKDQIRRQPTIVIAHTWKGLDDFIKRKAEALAELGYVAFAADLFGEGKTAASDDEAAQLILPLFLDRALLRKRINAAVDTIKKHPLVDKNAIGAIGFCFGGLTVIELLRSGADIRGAVSFHGAFGTSLGDKHASTLPTAKGIKGSLLLLHGNDDPLVSAEDIKNLQADLTHAGVDWQMHIYGHVMHAFTNPQAHDAAHGFEFNTKANARSWQSMRNFFDEIFSNNTPKETNMKLSGWTLLIYAILILAGGIVGYVKAQSSASLIMGTLFAAVIALCSYMTFAKSRAGAFLALAASGVLAAFFGFRFYSSLKFMPAGLMCIMSLIVFAIVWCNACACCKSSKCSSKGKCA